MPMQTLLVLAELKALGVCPCRTAVGGDGVGGAEVGETRATRWALRPPRCGAVQPGPAGAAVSGASGGIGSGHSRHQTPDTS